MDELLERLSKLGHLSALVEYAFFGNEKNPEGPEAVVENSPEGNIHEIPVTPETNNAGVAPVAQNSARIVEAAILDHPIPITGKKIHGDKFEMARHEYHKALMAVEPFDHETTKRADMCESALCRNEAKWLVVLPEVAPMFRGDQTIPEWKAYLCYQHTEREKWLATRFGYGQPTVLDIQDI